MGSALESVSDTARWVAMYRAIESERPDARFRDPFARRLAGARGEEIARTLPGFRSGLWPMVARTCAFDEILLRTIARDGADTVVNLAAGLDTRPWRMALPPSLRWFDVDLPGILGYKVGALGDERPVCAYQAVSADLTNPAERRDVLARIGSAAVRALVVTEGLLVYLADEEVGDLAEALHAVPTLRWWLLDLIAPRLKKMLDKRWGSSLGEARAPFRFAPAESTRFFDRFGWREIEYRSTLEEAIRVGRGPWNAWIWRLLGRFASPEKRAELKRLGGFALLERTG
jgi:methyltransferase (TIGR00027 family)